MIKNLFDFFPVLLILLPDGPSFVQVGDDLCGESDVVSDDLLVDREARDGSDAARQIAVDDRSKLAVAAAKC